MPKRVLSLLLAGIAVTLAPHAMAADDGAWTMTSDMIRVDAAGIAAPMTVATLALDKTGEISHGGQGIDNIAQYISADGAVQASIYVYMPSFADAALGAYMTDRAIMERFGDKTRRTAWSSASAGGHAGTAIRAVYDDAGDGALTTAAAMVHAGRWLIKLRTTGPAERRAEILAGLDAMLSGLRFDAGAAPLPATPPVTTACPTSSGGEARPVAADITAQQPGFPRDGRDRLCIRGRIDTASGRYDMLQAADGGNGSILVPLDDGGTVMAFDPTAKGGYRLSIHSVGRTEIFDAYDRLPSTSQIAAILDGKDRRWHRRDRSRPMRQVAK